MKAMRLNEWGKALELVEVLQPVPDADQVLVRVHAARLIHSMPGTCRLFTEHGENTHDPGNRFCR